MTEKTALTIGQVASRAGVRTSAIRYYERVGVLPEAERVSGQRRYDESVIERLGVIGVAQRAGFTLEEIAALLRASDNAAASTELRELAERKLPDVRALIERADAMRRWLEAATSCDCATLDVCDLFEPSTAPVELAATRASRAGARGSSAARSPAA
jgi:MerR family redox-sensitive transcriptional activator SoxR